MKRCPKCSRTYAEDGFTFCLEDGALLSAPYDPEKKEEPPISTIQSGGPPPTAVLSAHLGDKETASKPASDAPTIARPVSTPVNLPVSSGKKSRRRKVAISVLALIVIGGALSIYMIGKSNCRKVVVSCGSTQKGAAYCQLFENGSVLAFQKPTCEDCVTKVTWSTSGGRMDYQINYVTLNTWGLAGRQITVTANYAADSWFCSGSSSTTFIAQ